jgi:hypothetical protein
MRRRRSSESADFGIPAGIAIVEVGNKKRAVRARPDPMDPTREIPLPYDEDEDDDEQARELEFVNPFDVTVNEEDE